MDALQAHAARGLAEALDASDADWIVATAGEDAVPALRALWRRLAPTRIEVPPLRVRPDDVPALAQELVARHGSPTLHPRVRPEAAQLLARLPWPGNVRELENVVRLALARRHAGDLRLEDLPAELRAAGARNQGTALQRLEAEAIVEALAAADGNKRRAAQALGVSRSTLYRKLRAYGIELDRLAY